MKCIQEHSTQMLEIKQSKFIAHLVPYAHYDTTLAELKHRHPKARHFVVAWRYMNEFDQIVEHCSDDGEPKGTSGKPTLAVLAGNELIDSAVIIVRYFGGTKLGTGGLVRAYSDACNAVIKESVLLPYVKLERFVFFVNYSDITVIEYKLEEYGVLIESKSFDTHGVSMCINTQISVWKKFSKENERIICIQE